MNGPESYRPERAQSCPAIVWTLGGLAIARGLLFPPHDGVPGEFQPEIPAAVTNRERHAEVAAEGAGKHYRLTNWHVCPDTLPKLPHFHFEKMEEWRG
jgi:hypothetical protein